MNGPWFNDQGLFFFAKIALYITKGVIFMTDDEIRELYKKLEDSYSDGGYVSRATLFNRALNEGKITLEVRDRAKEYYGKLWTYVGD